MDRPTTLRPLRLKLYMEPEPPPSASDIFPLHLFASKPVEINGRDWFTGQEQKTLTYVSLYSQHETLRLFSMTSTTLWSYLHSYRQPENGAAKRQFSISFTLLRSYFMEYVMATKRPTPTPQRETYGQLTFLNLRLTDTQLDELDATKVTAAQLLANLVAAVETGYKFSFSYNAEKKQANAMLTDSRKDTPTYNCALSAFSDDCADALKLLIYKHAVVLNGDWSPLLSQQPTKRTRG